MQQSQTMQFPESWLRSFCNPPLNTAELAETLTMAGLEVEDLRPAAPRCSAVVVGAIVAAAAHPDSARLRVCQVDVGQGEHLTIVCGAPNARAGIKVPCALPGAELPPGADGKPWRIAVAQVRGVQSQGMLCSARELGLVVQDDGAGLLVLDAAAPPGRDIRAQLDLDDMLFTLKLTPNLAHCLSVYGIARELAALTGAPLRPGACAPVAATLAETLPVSVQAHDLCGRFCGRIVRHLNPCATTPRWMLERLARCGQRGVSPLVDISNYLMFEFGNPSHIFDLDKIHGALQVRWGRPGERLTLLNGSSVSVDEKVGVIADAQQLESLAGIMGGAASAVSAATQHIYIEAAFWWPQALAGRARRFHCATDAGHRFERGVDASQAVVQIERITRLVLDICGTPHSACGPIDDQCPDLPAQRPVRLRVARAAQLLGMPLAQQHCADALQRLGLAVEQGAGVLTATPPPWRFDLRLEEDLIEEVARLIGYDQLPATPPLAPLTPRLAPESARSPFALRRALARLGYQETINFGFVDARSERELAANPAPIALRNPISSQLTVMRSTLLGSLLQVLRLNLDHKAARVRLFEFGRVFLRDPGAPGSNSAVAGLRQPMRVAGLAYGPSQALQWGCKAQGVDFYDLKGDLEALLDGLQARFAPASHPAMHPGRCAQVLLGTRAIGVIGELHPQWRQARELPLAPVLFELELDALLQHPLAQARPLARQQPVERDLAVVVAERVTHAQVMDAVHQAELPAARLQSAVLFDVYRPRAAPPGAPAAPAKAQEHQEHQEQTLAQGEKSLALRLTLAGLDDATLSEAQIDSAMQALRAQLALRTGARLRA